MNLPLIHFDCKFFEGDKPCVPNKKFGVMCENCSYYESRADLPFDRSPAEVLERTPRGGSKEKQIMIIKLDAVGDVLRTTSILPSIKERYPDSKITWLTKSASHEILKNNKYIDSLQFVDKPPLNPVLHPYNIVFNLDSGKESCSITKSIDAEEKFGFGLLNGIPCPLNESAREWYIMGIDDTAKKVNTKTYHRIIHDICGLEYKNSKPALEVTEEIIEHSNRMREKYNLKEYSQFILINLGGGNRWQYKKWTKEGYSELVNILSESGQTAVGVIAGNEDRDFYDETTAMTAQKKNIVRLGCDNSLTDFIALVYLADKIFTSDSLALHIATAFNKYTICITGPTSFTELDIFGNGKLIHSGKVDCLSCYLNTCGKIINCMNTVSAKDVVQYLL